MQKCDEISWEEFHRIYWPLVDSIGRRLGMLPEDCKDLMQEIMLELFNGGAFLHYDTSRGKFRTFLGVLIRHKVSDMLRKSTRFSSAGRMDVGNTPENAADLKTGQETATENPQHENDPFQEMFDEEYRSFLLSVAMNELRNTVEPKTYAIFELVALQGRPPLEVARHLGVSRPVVDVYCSRCRKKLQRIMSEIHADNPDFNLDLPHELSDSI